MVLYYKCYTNLISKTTFKIVGLITSLTTTHLVFNKKKGINITKNEKKRKNELLNKNRYNNLNISKIMSNSHLSGNISDIELQKKIQNLQKKEDAEEQLQKDEEFERTQKEQAEQLQKDEESEKAKQLQKDEEAKELGEKQKREKDEETERLRQQTTENKAKEEFERIQKDEESEKAKQLQKDEESKRIQKEEEAKRIQKDEEAKRIQKDEEAKELEEKQKREKDEETERLRQQATENKVKEESERIQKEQAEQLQRENQNNSQNNILSVEELQLPITNPEILNINMQLKESSQNLRSQILGKSEELEKLKEDLTSLVIKQKPQILEYFKQTQQELQKMKQQKENLQELQKQILSEQTKLQDIQNLQKKQQELEEQKESILLLEEQKQSILLLEEIKKLRENQITKQIKEFLLQQKALQKFLQQKDLQKSLQKEGKEIENDILLLTENDILLLIPKLKQNIQGLEQNIQGLKQNIQGLKQDIQELQQELIQREEELRSKNIQQEKYYINIAKYSYPMTELEDNTKNIIYHLSILKNSYINSYQKPQILEQQLQLMKQKKILSQELQDQLEIEQQLIQQGNILQNIKQEILQDKLEIEQQIIQQKKIQQDKLKIEQQIIQLKKIQQDILQDKLEIDQQENILQNIKQDIPQDKLEILQDKLEIDQQKNILKNIKQDILQDKLEIDQQENILQNIKQDIPQDKLEILQDKLEIDQHIKQDILQDKLEIDQQKNILQNKLKIDQQEKIQQNILQIQNAQLNMQQNMSQLKKQEEILQQKKISQEKKIEQDLLTLKLITQDIQRNILQMEEKSIQQIQLQEIEKKIPKLQEIKNSENEIELIFNLDHETIIQFKLCFSKNSYIHLQEKPQIKREIQLQSIEILLERILEIQNTNKIQLQNLSKKLKEFSFTFYKTQQLYKNLLNGQRSIIELQSFIEELRENFKDFNLLLEETLQIQRLGDIEDKNFENSLIKLQQESQELIEKIQNLNISFQKQKQLQLDLGQFYQLYQRELELTPEEDDISFSNNYPLEKIIESQEEIIKLQKTNYFPPWKEIQTLDITLQQKKQLLEQQEILQKIEEDQLNLKTLTKDQIQKILIKQQEILEENLNLDILESQAQQTLELQEQIKLQELTIVKLKNQLSQFFNKDYKDEISEYKEKKDLQNLCSPEQDLQKIQLQIIKEQEFIIQNENLWNLTTMNELNKLHQIYQKKKEDLQLEEKIQKIDVIKLMIEIVIEVIKIKKNTNKNINENLDKNANESLKKLKEKIQGYKPEIQKYAIDRLKEFEKYELELNPLEREEFFFTCVFLRSFLYNFPNNDRLDYQLNSYLNFNKDNVDKIYEIILKIIKFNQNLLTELQENQLKFSEDDQRVALGILLYINPDYHESYFTIIDNFLNKIRSNELNNSQEQIEEEFQTLIIQLNLKKELRKKEEYKLEYQELRTQLELEDQELNERIEKIKQQELKQEKLKIQLKLELEMQFRFKNENLNQKRESSLELNEQNQLELNEQNQLESELNKFFNQQFLKQDQKDFEKLKELYRKELLSTQKKEDESFLNNNFPFEIIIQLQQEIIDLSNPESEEMQILKQKIQIWEQEILQKKLEENLNLENLNKEQIQKILIKQQEILEEDLNLDILQAQQKIESQEQIELQKSTELKEQIKSQEIIITQLRNQLIQLFLNEQVGHGNEISELKGKQKIEELCSPEQDLRKIQLQIIKEQELIIQKKTNQNQGELNKLKELYKEKIQNLQLNKKIHVFELMMKIAIEFPKIKKQNDENYSDEIREQIIQKKSIVKKVSSIIGRIEEIIRYDFKIKKDVIDRLKKFGIPLYDPIIYTFVFLNTYLFYNDYSREVINYLGFNQDNANAIINIIMRNTGDIISNIDLLISLIPEFPKVDLYMAFNLLLYFFPENYDNHLEFFNILYPQDIEINNQIIEDKDESDKDNNEDSFKK